MPLVTDKKIAEQVDELAALNNEIRLLKDKMKGYAAKAKGLETALRPVLEGLAATEQRVLLTEKNVVEIMKRGFSKRNPKYKDAFNLALTKVNEATKKILSESLESSTTVSYVASSIASRSRTDESLKVEVLGKIFDKVKTLVSKFINKIKGQFKTIDKANNVLGKLAKMPEPKTKEDMKNEQILRKLIENELKKVQLNESDVVKVMSIRRELSRNYPKGWRLFDNVISNRDFEEIYDTLIGIIEGEEYPRDTIEDVFSTLDSLAKRI